MAERRGRLKTAKEAPRAEERALLRAATAIHPQEAAHGVSPCLALVRL